MKYLYELFLCNFFFLFFLSKLKSPVVIYSGIQNSELLTIKNYKYIKFSEWWPSNYCGLYRIVSHHSLNVEHAAASCGLRCLQQKISVSSTLQRNGCAYSQSVRDGAVAITTPHFAQLVQLRNGSRTNFAPLNYCSN